MRSDPTRVLIVDDKDNEIEVVRVALHAVEPSWKYFVAKGRKAALELIADQLRKHEPITVLITDLNMDNDNKSGIKLISEAQEIDRRLMAILYTIEASLYKRHAISVKGAFDFVQRTGEESIRLIVKKARMALRYGWLQRFPDRRFLETVERDESVLIPQRRTVSIAFWDIRGFSTLCVQAAGDPEQIATFLRAYCGLAESIIYEHHGILDKFIGDGVMALFGVQDNSEADETESALQAVRAAKKFNREFNAMMNDEWQDKLQKKIPGIVTVNLGCGIHTGEAIVGNLGTAFRDQFTAIGPHVNFAQRLESMAAKRPPELEELDTEKSILVSASTATYVRGKDGITLSDFATIPNVKNIPGAYRIYFVAPQ